HAVAVVDDEVVLHARPLFLVALRWNLLAELGLLALEIGVGELVHGLVQERAGAHGGLANGQIQDLVGGEGAGFAGLAEPLLERVLGEARGEDLGRVVRSIALAVAAGEAKEVGALGVAHGATALVAHLLLVLVLIDAALRHEVGAGVRVVDLVFGAHLVQLFFGEEAGIREQALVHGAELVDAELRVGDAPALAAPAFARE